LTFTDGNSHQVALYLLDWDNYTGGRTELVEVLDGGNNATLDSRSVSGFVGGQYLVWNLSGHVVIRVTNTKGAANAVMSGLFFGAGGTTPSGGSAAYLRTDTATHGTWQGVYGGDGGVVVGDMAGYPAYAAVTPSGNFSFTWASSTTDARAPQKFASTTDRVAACWCTAGVMSVDLRFTDGNSHQVALYLLDWDGYAGGRAQRVELLDGNTGAVLDSRSISGFTGGQYLVWNLSGHVVARVTNTNGSSNAVISGLFFGGGASLPANTATFLRTDTTTHGTWQGTFGTDGGIVVGDSASYPPYASLTPSGNFSFTWTPSTADSRAPQRLASSTDRVAACWCTAAVMSLDISFNDGGSHQAALYMLDWDNYAGGRAQLVEVLDGATNAVLDTRAVSAFTGGQYLVWNLSGHVIVRITNTNAAANAVISALLFR
jgi:hypothetical protein